jgi:hypothetical protein
MSLLAPNIGQLDIEKMFRNIIKRLAALESNDTGWLSPTAAANWADGSKYRRLNGVVYLYLNFTRTAGTGSGTANTPILTLPVGFRPTYSVYFEALQSETGSARPIYINNLGAVQSVFAIGDGSGTLGWISFPADR